jgi:glycosyltransferase involved in cell wall biosynthesis
VQSMRHYNRHLARAAGAQQMRIFEATDCYPPPLIGGRDLAVQLLSRELVRRGHEVDVLTMAGPKGPRTERDGDVRVHRLAGWSRVLNSLYADPEKPFHPTLPDPGLARAISRLIEERQPDIVHVHSWLLYSLLPLLPSPKTRLVVWVHDYGFVCPKATYSYRGGVCTGPGYMKCVSCSSEQYGGPKALALTTGLAAMKPWRGRVDRYVANSQFIADASAPLVAGSGARMSVIPPFVPDEAFHAAQGPRPAFVPAVGDYLMFAGALGPHKGIDVLLEAWSGLRNRPPLVLAGIRRFDTPRSFPPGVIVTDDVLPREEVLRAWGHCLAAVVPSVWPEPFGLVAAEAMAAGKPVVASAVGGLAELVQDGITGIHVPPGDVTALRNALERIVADAPLRARLGAAGRERAQAYSPDVVVGAWEQVFNDVLETRTQGLRAQEQQ